ncbi:MAG: PIG-L family deacetylase, partial [Pseudomonadota bacterium]
MATPDQARITAHAGQPRIVRLWRALQPLGSVVSFMNTGAHPDDETSAMLAALGHRDGLDISYACSTRGEGGQNDIGTEGGADLGVLRTLEMERAADALGLRLYWLSETPDDPITDFGFSKSGEDTLRRWGHARTLTRFVEIVRAERPDIICPTFLDIPGQHGHHRAMTALAHEVMDTAADPAFAAKGAPWQVKKLYLPAWSGAGDAYDDDLPPPEATCAVPATGE